MKQSSGIAKNSLMLMAMNIAKMLFPLLTLPYLTRVLSTDCYGSVVYVKSVTTYLQLLVDFGFVLSATKSIVQAFGGWLPQGLRPGKISACAMCGKALY